MSVTSCYHPKSTITPAGQSSTWKICSAKRCSWPGLTLGKQGYSPLRVFCRKRQGGFWKTPWNSSSQRRRCLQTHPGQESVQLTKSGIWLWRRPGSVAWCAQWMIPASRGTDQDTSSLMEQARSTRRRWLTAAWSLVRGSSPSCAQSMPWQCPLWDPKKRCPTLVNSRASCWRRTSPFTSNQRTCSPPSISSQCLNSGWASSATARRSMALRWGLHLGRKSDRPCRLSQWGGTAPWDWSRKQSGTWFSTELEFRGRSPRRRIVHYHQGKAMRWSTSITLMRSRSSSQ